MGKLLKIIFGLLAVVIGLLVVLAVVLPFIVDPNDFKGQIAAQVEAKTGRTLSIDGDIDLSVFPWLGLEIGPTRLSNAKGFGDQPMVSMENVKVRVKLLPLLRKQLEMDTVKLQGMKLNLAKDVQGRTNWEDLQGETTAEAEAKPADEGVAPGALASLAIGGVQVSDAQLVWDDRSTKARYVIDALSLSTGAVEPGKPFDLDLHFRMDSGESAMAGEFDLQGEILVASSMQAVNIDGMALRMDVQGEAVLGGSQVITLATDLALDMGKQTLQMPKLVLKTLGIEVTGDASGTAITGKDPRFSGTLRIAEFVPKDVLKALGQDLPKTADASVLGKAGGNLQWEASSRHAAAKSLQFQLDDTRLTGNLRMDQFDKPAIDFALQADQFDLDRYLPPPDKDSAPVAATPAAAAAGLPVETLRGLNLSGNLKLGSLKAYNLRSTDIELQIKAKDGLLRLNPAAARMYEGQYKGDVTVDVRGKTARLAMDEHVTGVQAGPLLKDLTGDAKLTGVAEVHAMLNGSGDTPEQLRRTLNGTTSFSFTDGSVKGVNLTNLIREAQAKLKGQSVPGGNQPNQTDFAELRGTATVTNGLVRNDDLSLKSPLLRITGKGQASLSEETIDYLLTAKIVGSLEGQGGKGLEELKGVSIPVRIGGTFSKPTYRPDLGAAVSEAAKAKVEEKVEEQKEKLQQKLEEKIQDKLLKGIFK